MISKPIKRKIKTKSKRKNPTTDLDKLVNENVIIWTQYITVSGILHKATETSYYIRESFREKFIHVNFDIVDVTKIKLGAKEIWLDWTGGWAD